MQGWSRSRHANGRRATAAVTRYGCRRGTSFEGYDVRRGDLATAPTRPHRRAPVGTSTKRGEPHDRQRDATSPQTPGGGSRRGGEKPRGRNRTLEVDPREPKRGGHVAQEWTPGAMSMEGRTVRLPVSWPGHADESHERRIRARFGSPHGAPRLHDQGDRPVLQSGVKAMRVRASHVFRDVVGRGARETSKASRATGNRQGGRGKVQRPAARAPRATVIHRKVGGTPRPLKARSTAQERHPKELGLNADRTAML